LAGYIYAGGYKGVSCDRLPFPLDACPTCGGGIKVNKGFTKINPLALFGQHKDCQDLHPCWVCDPTGIPAFIMLVGEQYYPKTGDFMKEALTLGVSKRIPFIPKDLKLGETVIYLAHHKACERKAVTVDLPDDMNPEWPRFTVYRTEDGHWHAKKMGSEKRAKWLTELQAQENAPQTWCIAAQDSRKAIAAVKKESAQEHQLGIFTAFVPHKVEKLIWESQATEKALKELADRGITPVVIKDGDTDHGPKPKKAPAVSGEATDNEAESQSASGS
jgi:hypothetical protein